MAIVARCHFQGRSRCHRRPLLRPQFRRSGTQSTGRTLSAVYPLRKGSFACCTLALGPVGLGLALALEQMALGYPPLACSSGPLGPVGQGWETGGRTHLD